jgi:hypothetical protein
MSMITFGQFSQGLTDTSLIKCYPRSWSFLSYLREIILHTYDNSIEYHVMELNDDNATERFLFKLSEAESKNMSFQGVNEFTGIE